MKKILILFIASMLTVSFFTIGQVCQKNGNNTTNIATNAILKLEYHRSIFASTYDSYAAEEDSFSNSWPYRLAN